MFLKYDNESFGQYIARLRDAKGYSQRKLAMISGISNTTIGRIEKGETENPDLPTLTTLARHLGVDESYMLSAAGYIENKDQVIDNKNKINKENEDVFEQLGTIIKRDAKPLTDKDKERLLRIIESAWPVDDTK